VTSFLQIGKSCAEHLEEQLRQLGNGLENVSRVLDFGCGCGRTLAWLIEQYPMTHFYGVDVDKEAGRVSTRDASVWFNFEAPFLKRDSSRRIGNSRVHALSQFRSLSASFGLIRRFAAEIVNGLTRARAVVFAKLGDYDPNLTISDELRRPVNWTVRLVSCGVKREAGIPPLNYSRSAERPDVIIC
jgi:SAM-dependent methyltransferase